MSPKPSTLTGYSETDTIAELPTLDLGDRIAVAVETSVELDGITSEVSLSTISVAGVVVGTLAVSPEIALELGAALIRAGRTGLGIR